MNVDAALFHTLRARSLSLISIGCAFLTSLPAETPPWTPSPVIRQLNWAPVSTIVRQARDSDNWPLTWADDDALYTTYGDGTGFVPKVDIKLSCGFARIDGNPTDFKGINIRSPQEQIGQGKAGLKAWGILSVNGTLWLWFGNANKRGGTTRLAWSSDRARTWTFADWTLPEFGSMGFVNFGRDYAGARDDYVYAYSHDNPDGNTPADRFVLLRAPKSDLASRAAWEVFHALDAQGCPVWRRDFAERGSVFSHRDNCLRSAITYNASLRRYLWWQQRPQPAGHERPRGDTRASGGFAIYDAPEPWGPWTAVYSTENWDVGPGEHADFPAKWMSADGRNLHLVFSGDDTFAVRAATLDLR